MDSDGRSPPPHLPPYFDPASFSGHLPYGSSAGASSTGALFGSAFNPYAAVLPYSLAYPGLGLLAAGDYGSMPSLASTNPGLYPLAFGGYSSLFAPDFVNLGLTTAAAAAASAMRLPQSIADTGYLASASNGPTAAKQRATAERVNPARKSPASGRATPAESPPTSKENAKQQSQPFALVTAKQLPQPSAVRAKAAEAQYRQTQSPGTAAAATLTAFADMTGQHNAALMAAGAARAAASLGLPPPLTGSSKPTAVISHTNSVGRGPQLSASELGGGATPRAHRTLTSAAGGAAVQEPGAALPAAVAQHPKKGWLAEDAAAAAAAALARSSSLRDSGSAAAVVTSVIVSPPSAQRLHSQDHRCSPPAALQRGGCAGATSSRTSVIASSAAFPDPAADPNSPEGPLDLCAKKKTSAPTVVTPQIPQSPEEACHRQSVKKSEGAPPAAVASDDRPAQAAAVVFATGVSQTELPAAGVALSPAGVRTADAVAKRPLLNGTPPSAPATPPVLPPPLVPASGLPTAKQALAQKQLPAAAPKYEALPNLKRFAEQLKLQKERAAAALTSSSAEAASVPVAFVGGSTLTTCSTSENVGARKEDSSQPAAPPAKRRMQSVSSLKERKGRAKPLSAGRLPLLPPPLVRAPSPQQAPVPSLEPQVAAASPAGVEPNLPTTAATLPTASEGEDEEERKKRELRAVLEMQLKQQQHKIRLEKKARREQEKVRLRATADALPKWTTGDADACSADAGDGEVLEAGDNEQPSRDLQPMDVGAQEEIAADAKTVTGASAVAAAGAGAAAKAKAKKRRKKRDIARGGTKESPAPRRAGVKRAAIEENLKKPLLNGWRRETRIRKINARGRLLGEVHYYTPNDKKLRSSQDVVKYLEENSITDLTKDNFSFSTKVCLGEFLEPQTVPGAEGEPAVTQYVTLTDEQRDLKLAHATERRAKQLNKVKRVRMKKLGAKDTAGTNGGAVRPRATEEKKQRRQVATAEASAKVLEEKIRRRQQRLQQAELAKKAKEMKVLERTAQQEQRKVDKQRRLEAMRAEKEMRSRQMIEARLRKKEDLRRSKLLALAHKAQEKERKRIQALQQKASEARKKEEERERNRMEKQMVKRMRLEQKHTDLLLARELRKPVEDLLLQETKVLPRVDRIPGLKMSGQAFADLLMAVEFCRNFGDCLKLSGGSGGVVPSLNDLQRSVLGEQAATGCPASASSGQSASSPLSTLVRSLLQVAVHDPGVVNPKKTRTALNQKLTDVSLNDENYSEVLRIFLESRCPEKEQLTKLLATQPYSSLSARAKASTLAVLCDELLYNKAVLDEIDANLEKMAVLRRSKWELEGGLRRLKAFQKKMHKHPTARAGSTVGLHATADSPGGCSLNTGSVTGANVSCGDRYEGADGKESDDDGSAASESDGGDKADDDDDATAEGEECAENAEELEKKLETQGKQHSQLRARVHAASQKLRVLPLGSDRHHRRYWLLPSFSGVLLEAAESAVPSLAAEQYHGSVSDDGNAAAECRLGVSGELRSQARHEADEDGSRSEGQQRSSRDCATPRNSPWLSAPHVKPEPANFWECRGQAADNGGGGSHPGIAAGRTSRDSLAATPAASLLPAPVCVRGGGGGGFHGASHSSIASWLNSTIDSAYGAVDGSGWPLASSPLKLDGSSCGTPWQRASAPFNLASKVPCDRLSSLIGPTDPRSAAEGRRQNASPGAQQPWSSALVKACDGESSRFGKLEDGCPYTRQPVLLAKPRLVPQDAQKGWWRLTEYSQVKAVQRSLQQRGMREKQLSKALQKHGDIVAQACSNSTTNKLDLALDITDKDREISQNGFNAPLTDDDDENDERQLQDEEAGDGSATTGCTRRQKAMEECARVARQLLAAVERLEDRVCTASMHAKSWTCPPKLCDDIAAEDSGISGGDGGLLVLNAARERLLCLESGIERRYLKPPLSKLAEVSLANVCSTAVSEPACKDGSSSARDGATSDDNEDTRGDDSRLASGSSNNSEPPGLLLWREAVQRATSAAQLQMCAAQLNDSVAWEKSIMRVRCQLCRYDDNEAQLLLCDSCDKGYHTYCFKPRMTVIPEGNWYCWECRSRAAAAGSGGGIVPHCLRCGGRTGKLALCVICSLALHIDCMDPPQNRMPRKWYCANCSEAIPSRGNRRRRSKAGDSSSDESDEDWSLPENKKGKRDSAAASGGAKDDLSCCRALLADMEKQHKAEPFLQPVDVKEVPSYSKYIKHPMDMSTMKQKLKDGSYKSRQEFAADAQLMFDNCELFNEDNSETGRAGRWMRRYFNKRWKELVSAAGASSDD